VKHRANHFNIVVVGGGHAGVEAAYAAVKLKQINSVYESFPVSGQFDAIAVIEVKNLSEIKDVTTDIQKIQGVEWTETMVQVQ